MTHVTYDCGKLNLIPGVAIPTVVHCSYGDSGVTVQFQIYKYKELFSIPSGAEANVYGVRADGANWGPVQASINGSTVTFELNSTITGFEGACIAELELELAEDNKVMTIGTANFAIMVEPAAWGAGVAYEDDISVYRSLLRYVKSSVKSANQIIKSAQDAIEEAADTARNTVESLTPGLVESWLNKNVSPSSGLIDSTLSIKGAGADAKETGDQLRKIRFETVSPFLRLSALNDYHGRCINDLFGCCEDVSNDLRGLKNDLLNLEVIFEPVYLQDTDGRNLLATDGTPLLVSF